MYNLYFIFFAIIEEKGRLQYSNKDFDNIRIKDFKFLIKVKDNCNTLALRQAR